MVREGYEDYKRWKSDREFNSTPVMIYLEGEWVTKTFRDVQVGDLVKVRKDEFFPCDLIVLNSSEADGITLIETSSLDGEKNLKTKQARLEAIQYFVDIDKVEFFAEFSTEMPNPKIDQFVGNMKLRNGTAIPLDIKQLLLCGASLRNTGWAVGVACNTGEETKLRQNMLGRKFKQSQIEHKVNRNIMIILGLQAVFCFVSAVYGGAWVSTNYDDHWYLGDKEFEAPLTGFLLYCTYFLLLNTMIPISLIVTLEVVKLGQAYYMANDIEMYSSFRNRPCKVSDSTLNEELGQIQHIFTDKTGTLTINRMEFKFVTCANKTFGDRRDIMNPGFSRQATHTDDKIRYAFDDTELRGAITSHERIEPIKFDTGDGKADFRKMTHLAGKFMQAMALMHELLVDFDEMGNAKYNGTSPDEICIVDAARRIGVKYLGMNGNTMLLAELTENIPEKHLLEGPTHGFERVAIFEFTSDRKRASVILQDKETGVYWLFMKGADSYVLDRLGDTNCKKYVKKGKDDLDTFANEGFRTLAYACRPLDADFFTAWNVKYQEALNNVENRKAALESCALDVECDLTFLGCVAYEDKLQDGVPDTIYDLRQANIKIWMLTGDKLGTAISIGKSCRLIEENMLLLLCREQPIRETYHTFLKITKDIEDNNQDIENRKNVAFCIEGKSIGYMFYDDSDPLMRKKYHEIANNPELIEMAATMRQVFLDFAVECHSVICCRASPMEKASFIKLMKENKDSITLSIGDGANDVPMIQEAHIGVGLYGEEGMQAVQASDYALGEFKFLWELILAHGHWHYIRQSEMILYFFYKNFLFTFPQFIYCFFCASSGRTIHDDWYISLYNLIFTSLPLLVRALYETDEEPPKRRDEGSRNGRTNFTRLYAIGQENQIFTKTAFMWWVFKGFAHSIMVFFISYAALQSGILTTDGRNTDLVAFSVIQFTCIIFVVNLELALFTRAW
eukprot:CAMPEP_0204906754 /NCGR_PEP_ID=MMETSP1397-20131031/6140_1 /ASSEMBLY_ACC=CAM_ASM_000891 /TAXON_ID=49980 /ORGANISM="Climacostomum Climacostomum virens, Strain Stock W-24" /LENGTH=959 /DNA_ID=CAMNT_0052075759 /DNA_START=213 /DNA_END=3089 /DNA_ORIENTATION=-